MKSLTAHGQYPPSAVCRAFDEREHAEQFVRGRIRFGNLYYYKRSEDEKRRDLTEGESHVRYEGRDKKAMFALNKFYILCCHKTVGAAKKSSRGNHLVLIRDPRRFAKAITSTIENLPDNCNYVCGVEGCVVEYTKGHEIRSPPTSQDMARWAYCQKPEGFSPDEEYRFVVTLKESVGDSLTILLSEPENYLEHYKGI